MAQHAREQSFRQQLRCASTPGPCEIAHVKRKPWVDGAAWHAGQGLQLLLWQFLEVGQASMRGNLGGHDFVVH